MSLLKYVDSKVPMHLIAAEPDPVAPALLCAQQAAGDTLQHSSGM